MPVERSWHPRQGCIDATALFVNRRADIQKSPRRNDEGSIVVKSRIAAGSRRRSARSRLHAVDAVVQATASLGELTPVLHQEAGRAGELVGLLGQDADRQFLV